MSSRAALAAWRSPASPCAQTRHTENNDKQTFSLNVTLESTMSKHCVSNVALHLFQGLLVSGFIQHLSLLASPSGLTLFFYRHPRA